MADQHNVMVLIFGIIGNIITVGVFLAPVPIFRDIFRKRSVGGYRLSPYVVILVSAALWTYYAILKSSMLVISINSIGCAIEIIYIFVYIYYTQNGAQWRRYVSLLVGAAFMYVLIVVFTLYVLGEHKRLLTMRLICTTGSLAMYISPLTVVSDALPTNNVENMPILLTIFLTVNAIIWTCYGFIVDDYTVIIPNMLGILVGFSQIIIYMVCKRRAAGRTT